MKHLLTIVFVLFSFASFSQNDPIYYNCYKSIRGVWNKYSDKWDYDEPKVSSITFKVYKNIVTANDEAQSRYEMIGQGEKSETKDYSQINWDAFDEKKRKVNFSIVGYYESRETVFMVFYDGLVYVYFVNKSGLSPLY